MPIVLQKETNDQVMLAVWHITEQFDDLYDNLIGPDQDDILDHFVEKKKLEMIATRLLLVQLTKEMRIPYEGIWKDDHGKPHLKNSDVSISISHAFPYAAAIIDRNGPTGIDIELPREQIHRIKHKFLSDNELSAANNIDLLTIYWCAKECLYKIYGRKQLIFRRHLYVHEKDDGLLGGKINFNEQSEQFDMAYLRVNEHWLVYKLGLSAH